MTSEYYYPQVASTNQTLQTLHEEQILPEMTVVWTDYQSAGRGQCGNTWQTEAGKNLTFSLLIYPSMIPVARQFLISEISALSVFATLKIYSDHFHIKWANDLYWRDRKICGILIENELQGDRLAHSVIGIGLNINQEQFDNQLPNPVSLTQITGKQHDRETLMRQIIRQFESYYARLKNGEWDAIHNEYQALLIGRNAFCSYQDATAVFDAKIERIEPDGQLVLRKRDGSFAAYLFKEVQMLHANDCEWEDYELIDTGDYEKLERFGKYILRRPEPQAVWRKSLSEQEWSHMAHAWFKKAQGKSNGDEKGEWLLTPNMPQQWFIRYAYKTMQLQFRLGMTAFKHVGIFPEQYDNWNYIFDRLVAFKLPQAKVLNLFAYTGGASLAAKAAGADVTHVDSVKQVLSWSRENMEASGLDHIRWICEDALKFVKREVRRGNRYHGILLDPPAYGRGPEGEKWILEDQIAELMQTCSQLIDEQQSFCVLNLYSMGFSHLVADNLLKDYFPAYSQTESGELFSSDTSGRKLPLSVFARGSI